MESSNDGRSCIVILSQFKGDTLAGCGRDTGTAWHP